MNKKIVSLMGMPAEIYGLQDDPYFNNILSYIPQNYLYLDEICKLPKNAVVLDIGANIGLTTIMASRCVPLGKVIAVEPSPKAHACLKAAIDANNAKNCVVLNECVGSERGDVKFVERDFLAGSSIVDSSAISSEVSISCKVTTIDDIVEQNILTRVDLIKIDVEGYEMDVLQGALTTIRKMNPVFVMEYNSFALSANRRISPWLLLEFILKYFRKFYVMRDGQRAIINSIDSARDFMLYNMTVSGCVDDIMFKLEK